MRFNFKLVCIDSQSLTLTEHRKLTAYSTIIEACTDVPRQILCHIKRSCLRSFYDVLSPSKRESPIQNSQTVLLLCNPPPSDTHTTCRHGYLFCQISDPEHEQSKDALFLEHASNEQHTDDAPAATDQGHDGEGEHDEAIRGDEGYPYMRFYNDDYYYSEYSEEYYFEEELSNEKVSRAELVAERLAADIAHREHLCAFIPGYPHQRRYVEVTVKSVLLFMPGVRIAIAVEASELEEYQT